MVESLSFLVGQLHDLASSIGEAFVHGFLFKLVSSQKDDPVLVVVVRGFDSLVVKTLQ